MALAADFWPSTTAVNKLATDAKKMKDKGTSEPFVYVNVKHFLPSWLNSEHDKHAEDVSGYFKL